MASLLDRRPLTEKQQAILRCLGQQARPMTIPELATALMDQCVVGPIWPRSETRSALSGLVIRGLVQRTEVGSKKTHRWVEAYRLAKR
jgi:DNA-binding IclR family transcriptional regulator